ncbi:MAG: cob(I)yrinic acid a,c-diamide adenosyltransferase [Casimicrobiaceae bacterium]|nr:cob(I)yrinic acid a,c-diamide adenosyltransferase [Casimicrobiaceae bacterium]MCX8098980.1 cob(I)yrinic acid a,c-diamide adenosyltransferase [Casimicrobiaceae bacterium]MDW8313087.1 cob(I)yrinic acid a,c-diamide adenosyltransferase [Burkholderiales bacterium]
MRQRLTKITTKTGDGGSTGLADGRRLSKDHPRIVAIGEVDELNAAVGLLLTEPLPESLRAAIETVQHDLFDVGGELALPDQRLVTDAHVARLEALTAELNAELPPLAEFILPGGTRPAALAHLVRTVARRAERAVVALAAKEPVGAPLRVYLNRLSDLAFVLARQLNRAAGRADVLWRGRALRPTSDEA